MAYVLPIQPQSPLKRSFSDQPYLGSYSTLLRNMERIVPNNLSTCSLYDVRANEPRLRHCTNENMTPWPTKSPVGFSPMDRHADASLEHTGEPQNFIMLSAPLLAGVVTKCIDHSLELSDGINEMRASESPETSEAATCCNMNYSHSEEAEVFDAFESKHTPQRQRHSSGSTNGTRGAENGFRSSTPFSTSPPFRRWMSTLRRRHAWRRKDRFQDTLLRASNAKHEPFFVTLPQNQGTEATRRTSGSISSSMGYVTTVQPASITVASTSVAPRSDMGTQRRRSRGTRSSAHSDNRLSLDSNSGVLGAVVDEMSWVRSVQRRKVVEELVVSEESYIADLKVLINDYFTVITALPGVSGHTKSSIMQNMSQILQLHEDLLGDLHHLIPQADYTQTPPLEIYPVTKARHIRFHSTDINTGRLGEHKVNRKIRHSLDIGRSPDSRPRGLVTDTQTAGSIAKIFNKHMKRFFTYEEYGAHWTTMSRDLTLMYKGVYGWQEYERGIEALSKVVASKNNCTASSKKALTFSDLLIKPIQRVCKYPLLFKDLCRNTPVYDDPEAHAELEKTLFRIQETIREINQAKDDPRARRLIEITWQLQDRLVFHDETMSPPLIFRFLGHILLCGVLHIAYQTPQRVKGQYMICILYKSFLLLATANRFHTPYKIVASISLANANVEEPSHGRGIQCHTAPFTWKVIFESGHRIYEVVLSACSSQEETVWKQQLRERISIETHDFAEGQIAISDMFSPLFLDIKSLGPVFGHPNSLVRRMSVHRAATLGAKAHVSQVIIKNTQAQKVLESPPTFSPSVIARSQSHMSANHIPILAPRRIDRIRLEAALEDVWTKDLLPFPGMSSRRVEKQIRASANSVMRKLSMASIASNFSRRSPSYSSAGKARSEESLGSKMSKKSEGDARSHSVAEYRPSPTIVDFHRTPAAFLPADFELRNAHVSTQRRRLPNQAMTDESPVEKIIITKPTRVRRLSTQIMNLPRSGPSSLASARTASHSSHTTVERRIVPSTGVKNAPSAQFPVDSKQEGSSPHFVASQRSITTKILKSKSRIFKFWA